MSAQCPICDSERNVIMYGKNDIVTLYECKECRFAFQDRRIYRSPFEEMDYYDPTRQPTEVYPLVPTKTDEDRLRKIKKMLPHGKILDIGGGVGRTSILASSIGYDVTITEESSMAVKNGIEYHPQLKWIHTSVIPGDLKKNEFDAIMMFHVLEHIPDLKPFLNEATKALKSESYFVVEVPNWMSVMRKIKKMNWLYVVDCHPNQFSKHSLTKLFRSFGFHPVSVEYRRTFAINEQNPMKERLKQVLCMLGFGNVLRIVFERKSS